MTSCTGTQRDGRATAARGPPGRPGGVRAGRLPLPILHPSTSFMPHAPAARPAAGAFGTNVSAYVGACVSEAPELEEAPAVRGYGRDRPTRTVTARARRTDPAFDALNSLRLA